MLSSAVGAQLDLPEVSLRAYGAQEPLLHDFRSKQIHYRASGGKKHKPQTERNEIKTFPFAVGADLIAGSLIKNPGGSIAPGGGYVAGREALVDAAAARLSAPGIGRDAGATSSSVQRLMLQVRSEIGQALIEGE